MILFLRQARRACAPLVTFACFSLLRATPLQAIPAHDLDDQVAQLENHGDLASARSLLQQQAANADNDPGATEALAKFLDRHNDPETRAAYIRWAEQEKDSARRKLALRQVVLLDYIGDKPELSADLAKYRETGGTDLAVPAKPPAAALTTVTIPGPLRSFARMAALSPDLDAEELLPALARNVVTNGYEASGNEALQQTEYLRLLIRYIGQARELQAMAGSNRKIVIPNCDSEETGNLLKVLGYRMRGSCGADIVLETVNATRAFLTVDSAFPLTELEGDLRGNHRFELPYAPTSIPVLYGGDYWMNATGRAGQGDFIDAFLSDPALCRLYLGLSHLDRETAEMLRKHDSAARLKVYAHVLDFFGSMFQVRNGAAVVPGSQKVWASLTGVSPSNPGAFFEKLLATDDGWLASYFDALSRLEGPTAAYLTQPERMRRFYEALRGKITSPGPARPVFRSSTELLLLTTSLRIDSNGQPHIPGNLEVWQTLFIKHPHGKYDGRLTRSAASWHTNDDLIESLFALSRKSVENEPLKIFLVLNDIDKGRAKPLSAALTARLINGYRTFGSQYILFADMPSLSEASIGHFMDVCADTQAIRDTLLRADTVGTFQSLVGIWQILALQNMIPVSARDSSFAKLVSPFSHIRQEAELFEAGRSGVDVLISAAQQKPGTTRQEQLVTLLVGHLRTASASAPFSPSESFLRVFDAQRLLPLDTLFNTVDRNGKLTADPKAVKSLNEGLGRLNETELTRSSLSPEERNTFAVGYWSERHIEQERKISSEKLLKNTGKDPRDALAPLLRDSLLGILYSYYTPAGAQLLITNPVFVRNHDFIGPEGTPAAWRPTEVSGTGWPASAGGRLSGSLITLPYAIAEAEQNFLMPRREQALIWSDLVPQMIVNVTVTRWRNVQPDQVRWVSLHIRQGQLLLAAATLDARVRQPVLDAYSRFSTPSGVEWLRDQLQGGHVSKAISQVPPSVLFAIACDPALVQLSSDVTSEEIAAIASHAGDELSPESIAQAFGTPKPTLTHSYRPGLLYLRTFPALMGYSSRILAETWESNNLYYAALADETGVPVDQLDAYVPEWNRSAIENIFATHLEDWPAILRSLNTTANTVRQRSNNQGVVAAGAAASEN